MGSVKWPYLVKGLEGKGLEDSRQRGLVKGQVGAPMGVGKNHEDLCSTC